MRREQIIEAFAKGNKRLRLIRTLSAFCFNVGDIVEAAVIIESGYDYHGQQTSGVILRTVPATYPYVWDFDRFEVYSGDEKPCLNYRGKSY